MLSLRHQFFLIDDAKVRQFSCKTNFLTNCLRTQTQFLTLVKESHLSLILVKDASLNTVMNTLRTRKKQIISRCIPFSRIIYLPLHPKHY